VQAPAIGVTAFVPHIIIVLTIAAMILALLAYEIVTH
jgi:hypothetical protein